MGIPGNTVKVPPKPEALVLYQQMEALHLPLVAGGVIDQPHIWLQEVSVVIDVVEIFAVSNQLSSS